MLVVLDRLGVTKESWYKYGLPFDFLEVVSDQLVLVLGGDRTSDHGGESVLLVLYMPCLRERMLV